MRQSDRARRVLFGEPAAMSVVIVDSAVHVEYFGQSHIEQGGKGCVSVFWAAGGFQCFCRWAQ